MSKLEELAQEYAELSGRILVEANAEIRDRTRAIFPDATGIVVFGEDVDGETMLGLCGVLTPTEVDDDDPRVERLADRLGAILDWLTLGEGGRAWWGEVEVQFVNAP